MTLVAWNAGCNCGPGQLPETESTTTTAVTTDSTTTNDLPCGVDCSMIETPQCTVAVCNTGQVIGPLNTCIVVPAPTGTSCDDGKFCTIGEACDNGACVGGTTNSCGKDNDPCLAVVCYEESKSCDTSPVNDGTECTPKDPCKVDGVCQLGQCVGQPKDCTFSPANECNLVACDPASGKCVGVADSDKDDTPCFLSGDPCSRDKTCKTGVCQGGTPKDCSDLNVGCKMGVCNSDNGVCESVHAAPGTPCSEGVHDCDVGSCDDKGMCVASLAPNGAECNDHNSCTKTDTCTAGVCAGDAVSGCSLYYYEGFESCPAGWTLSGDWECGKPENVGPTEAHTGQNCMATQIDAVYHVNQSFDTTTADSPPIDLTAAVNPVLSFWAWDRTEGGTFDGWNLKISTDGGATFSLVTTVTPDYVSTIAMQSAWGGDHSAAGWQPYSANLTGYAGQTVILRFAFRSDGATVYPGVYIDDVVVAEPEQNPLYITTETPLADTYTDVLYSVQMTKVGGSNNVSWGITDLGNAGWLVLDTNTGLVTGTPSSANVGVPVKFKMRVQDGNLSTNFDEKIFTFNVKQAIYYTSFEGACPDNWTLTGDWHCGTPTAVGPATAYVGSQCIATKKDGNFANNYSNLQTYGGTTATSPPIDLTGAVNPTLTFKMWVDTEGGTHDGFNLWISTDDGATFTHVDNVNPPYPLTVNAQDAWGGHLAALGWQSVTASLSGFSGVPVRLRFAFRSDSSGVFPGVYIDDFLVK